MKNFKRFLTVLVLVLTLTLGACGTKATDESSKNELASSTSQASSLSSEISSLTESSLAESNSSHLQQSSSIQQATTQSQSSSTSSSLSSSLISSTSSSLISSASVSTSGGTNISSSSSLSSSQWQNESVSSQISSSVTSSATSSSSCSSSKEIYFTVTTDGYRQSVKQGEKALEPNQPTRENYRFLGWFEGENQFSFDTLITRDYSLVSKWEEIIVPLPQATGVSVLSGKLLQEGQSFVTAQDYTIASLIGQDLIEGEFNLTFSGEGNHGVYFRLFGEQVYRGRPTGNYYALDVDAYGNLSLIKGINGARETLLLSLAIKGNYSSQNEYTFKVQILGDMIRIFHNTDLIVDYTDNSMPFGNQIAIYGEKTGAKFTVNSVQPQDGVLCAENNIVWSDSQKADSYQVKVGNHTQTVTGGKNYLDISSLNLAIGEYAVEVFRVVGTTKTSIAQTVCVVEGIPTDIDTYSGQWSLYGKDYYSKQIKSLALIKDKVLNGTISATVTPGTPNDCGLVFRCSSSLTSFWENAGASYYTALINSSGILLLGKVNYNGVVWSLLAQQTISNFNATNAYELQVQLYQGQIAISVNGIQLINYTDANYFTGTGTGFRAAGAGVRISPISISEIYYKSDFSLVNSQTGLPNGWSHYYENVTKPTFTGSSQGLSIATANINPNSIQYTDSAFNKTDYTLEMQVKIISGDGGRWLGFTVRGEQADGYFRTYLTVDGRTGANVQSNWNIGSGGVANGTAVNGTKLSAFAFNQTINIKVTVSGNNLYYYVNGTLVLTTTLGSNYASGTFGFTFGGGEYLIENITARSVIASDIKGA